MKKIIRDMCCGHGIPMEEYENQDSNIENLSRLMGKNKAVLYSLMDEQAKDRFAKYADCVEEYIALLKEKAFCEGVRFSAKFLVEALA